MDYLVRELGASYMHLETNIPVIVQVPEMTAVQEAKVGSFTESSDDNVLTGASVTALTGENVLRLPERHAVHNVERVEDVVSAGIRTMSRPKYTGNACSNCGAFTLRRSGTCHVCDSCGETSGCS
jgi:ribonucleoside-diphosphate reductase alpha chain